MRVAKRFITCFVLLLFSMMVNAYADNAANESYEQSLCSNPAYKCYSVRPSDTWVKLWPNDRERDIVMRLNRTNMPLRLLKVVVVPANLEQTDYMSLSPLPEHINPPGRKEILVELSKFAFGAYDEQGNLVKWGPVTSGRAQCLGSNQSCASVTGRYRIYRIQGENCISSAFPRETGGGAPMPWCMHYYRGYALHGSTLAGFVNKSQGCIRMFDSDAKWLNQNFVKHGTQIIVRR